MESSVLNDSDVTSVSEMAQAASGLSNMTTLPTSTSEMNALTQEVVSSIPQLIKNLFSSGRKGSDIQRKTTTGDSLSLSTELNRSVSTELNRLSNTSSTFVNNVLNTSTPTMKVDSETTGSPVFLHREFGESTASLGSTTPASSSVQTETDKDSMFGISTSLPVDTGNVDQSTLGQSTSLPVQTGSVAQSTFGQSVSSEMGNSHETPQQSTELASETRSWVTKTYQDVWNTTDSFSVETTTQFSGSTKTDIRETVTEKTFHGKNQTELARDVSPFINSVLNTTAQETDSTLLAFNDSFTVASTTTISPVTLCDFANHSFNNATDVIWRYPPVYDVIVDDDADDYDDSTAVMVAKVTTLAILAVAGVLGNALVIWSVVRQRHLHRPPFYYLLSLSLTDLSRAAFCLPLVLMTLLQGSVWRHGNSACDLFAFANAFFVLSSGVSLLDIAADRHLSLVYSRSYRRRSGGALNLVVVLLGWSLAFLVAFPPVVGVGSYAFEEGEGQCTLRHKFFRHNNDTLGFLMVFTALMLVTLFLYYRIFLALRAHRKMRPLDHEPARSATWTFVGPGANGQAFVNWVNGFGGTHLGNLPNLVRNPPRPNIARVVNLHVARNQHVTRLFFLMTLTFNALWLPYQVLSYWRVFGGAEGIEGGFITAAAWLSYGQVVVCPAVYFSSRGPARPRPSRADVSPQDKQEYLLESVHRKK